MPEVLGKLSVEISSDTSSFGKGLDTARGKLSSFSSDITKIAGTIGIAFAAKEVASFGFEVAKLAGEAEGVSAAFNKLPESEALMLSLKAATAGTVSELELMKRTVQAANFGIELEALPELLKFAALRAQQTGQSVDYLVDSIVTGIGRKSPLILDNLGISATALKDKLGNVSIAAADVGTVSKAVGAIASDELKKMGDFSDNTSTKVQRLSATWDNFKVTLGNAVNSSGVLQRALEAATIFLGGSAGDTTAVLKNQLTLLNESGIEGERYAEALAAVQKQAKLAGVNLIQLTDAATGLTKVVIDPRSKVNVIDASSATTQIQTIDSLQEKVKQLNEEFQTTDVNDQKRLENIGAEIIAVNRQIEVLDKLRKARKDSEVIPNTVDAYQAKIAELNKEIEKANINDTSRIRILSAQVSGYQDAIANVDRLKKSFTDFNDITIKVPDLSALLDPISQISKTEGGVTFTVNESAFDASMKRIEDRILETANNIKTTTAEVAAAIEVNLTGPISAALDGLATALGEAAVGVGDFGKDILKVVANFGAQLGKILIAEGVALLAAKFALKNPYTAIAAGVALVAISSALSAGIAKSHSSTIGGGGSAGGASPGRGVSQINNEPFGRSVPFEVNFRIEGTALTGVLGAQQHKDRRLGG